MELKNILCIFIIVFSSFYSQAQSDYREGFIITSNKDTIHGLIDFRDGSKNYKICNFKNNNNSKPVSYSPTDLTGYGFINDKFFLSKKLENNNVSEKAFLEVLITGAATLYRYQKIFYIEKDSFFYELTNEKQYKTIDGKKVLVESKQYISILRFLLHDCGSFIEKISNSKYSEKSLTHLIDTYNTCVGTSGITYKSQKPWVKSIVGISGGFKISRLNFFTNYTMHEHINHTRDRIITPIWGLSLNIFSPRISERISFHNDFYYLTTTYYMDKSTGLRV